MRRRQVDELAVAVVLGHGIRSASVHAARDPPALELDTARTSARNAPASLGVAEAQERDGGQRAVADPGARVGAGARAGSAGPSRLIRIQARFARAARATGSASGGSVKVTRRELRSPVSGRGRRDPPRRSDVVTAVDFAASGTAMSTSRAPPGGTVEVEGQRGRGKPVGIRGVGRFRQVAVGEPGNDLPVREARGAESRRFRPGVDAAGRFPTAAERPSHVDPPDRRDASLRREELPGRIDLNGSHGEVQRHGGGRGRASSRCGSGHAAWTTRRAPSAKAVTVKREPAGVACGARRGSADRPPPTTARSAPLRPSP